MYKTIMHLLPLLFVSVMETTESTDVVKLLEEVDFEKAALHMKSLLGKLSTEDLLYFYGRYKQARCGRCTEDKPGFFDFQAKQKWAAWSQLGRFCFVQVTDPNHALFKPNYQKCIVRSGGYDIFRVRI